MKYWYEGRSTRELYEKAYREFKRMYQLGCSIRAMEDIAESYPEHMRPQISQIWRTFIDAKPAINRMLEYRRWCLETERTNLNGYSTSGFAFRGKVYTLRATYRDGQVTCETLVKEL